MSAENLALVRGMADTRATLTRWNRDPWPVLRTWLGWSGAIALALLGTVLVVSSQMTPDPTPLALTGTSGHPWGEVLHIFGRNLLVLALHAMACVAGFMAGSSMPQLAAEKSGIDRAVHEHAGRFAILFVIAATLFSLSTQAYVLGSVTSTLSAQHDIAPALLIVGLLPHALPELMALFLPLAAWTIASRRGEWNQLLAATFATTALALPTLVVTAIVEVFASPRILLALMGS
jgi:hypothetical protein